ncbi:glycoside hydrolase family 2 TIM barrel-domain containing protein [Tsuneonella sp. HG222]
MFTLVVRRMTLLAAILCLAVPGYSPAQAGGETPRRTVMLTDGWRFKMGDASPTPPADTSGSGWEQVSVPHTWNRVGYYLPDPATHIDRAENINKAQGVGWYSLSFRAPGNPDRQRAWLQFDAASRTAEVWLNGVRLGEHRGAFSRFRFDVTGALRAGEDNLLWVRVDNTQPSATAQTPATFPLTGDFFIHGGLYRPVSLVFTDPVHIDMLDFGGPGAYATTKTIEGGNAAVEVRTRVRNNGAAGGEIRLVTQLLEATGALAAQAEQTFALAQRGSAEPVQQLEVPRARLWQGTADPYLYTLRTEIRASDGKILDAIEQPFGIRTMRLDPEQGFFLNGKPLRLHGVGLHQDWEGKGWALGEREVEETVAILREMGANTIRLTHYQHGRPIHEVADRTGLILWDEIAVVTAWTLGEDQTASPDLLANARLQLQELIRQNYNHASVAVWGLANEVDFGPGRPDFLGRPPSAVPDPMSLLAELNQLAKAEDPGRPTAVANCCEERGMVAVPDIVDAVDASGANRYFGWYYGKPSELDAHLDRLRAKHPGQPLSLSEYGAGGDVTMHADDPLGGPIESAGRTQPEEYQTWVHEETWKVVKTKPYLWATWLWNGFDFGSTVRREGDSQDINTKGLVTYDRQVKKDAFYFYKANWAATPTVHITGRRYTDRAYPVADVRVYSNAPSTTLSLNGRALGARSDCPDRICVWAAVKLSEGNNQLVASGDFAGGAASDTVNWTLGAASSQSFRIDSGAIMAPAAPVRFGSDAFFHGGTAGTADTPGGRGRTAVKASINGTQSRDTVATFREGDFYYRLPLARGRYTVVLTFVEPKAAGDTPRTFDVIANGRPLLEGFDIARAAGGALTEVKRNFRVTVGNSGLDLHFRPRAGSAIVSTVEVMSGS